MTDIKETYTFSLNSVSQRNSTEFTITLKEPVKLDPKYDHYVSLLSCGMSKSWFNIDPTLSNNTFLHSSNNGSTWATITISPGLWSITSLSAEIATITGNGITLQDDSVVGKVKVVLASGHQMKFKSTGFSTEFYKMLGFEESSLVSVTGLAPKLARIDHIAMVNIHCDLVSSQYSHIDQLGTNVIYTIPPRGDVGSFVQFDGVSYAGSEYKMRSSADIRTIRMWMTDQDNHPLVYGGDVTYIIRINSRLPMP